MEIVPGKPAGSQPSAPSAPPYRHSNARLAAVVVASANFMGSLDSTIITLAIPRMARSFAVQPLALAIGITVYIIVMATMLPASSWIADRLGPRRVLAAAIAGFAAASMLCGLSHSLGQFIAARALQAVFAALMTPVGNLVLFRVTERKDFVTAVAISTTPALIAPVIGPPLGGLMISLLPWPWIFYLNVPIGMLGVFLTLRFIPLVEGAPPRPFDVAGFLLTGSALAAMIYGLEQAGTQAGGGGGLALFAGGALLGGLAVRHLLRARHPIVSLDALRIRTFVATTITAGSAVRIPFRALNFILPLMLQLGLHLSPLSAGLLLLGYNGGDLVLKVYANRVVRRFGFRRPLVVSAALTALSSAAVACISPHMPWLVLFAMLTACGMVRSVLFTALMALTYADVPRERIADATVLNTVASQVVGALAISLSALILSGSAMLHGRTRDAIGLVDYRIAILGMAAIGALALLVFRRLAPDAGAEVSGHRPPAAQDGL